MDILHIWDSSSSIFIHCKTRQTHTTEFWCRNKAAITTKYCSIYRNCKYNTKLGWMTWYRPGQRKEAAYGMNKSYCLYKRCFHGWYGNEKGHIWAHQRTLKSIIDRYLSSFKRLRMVTLGTRGHLSTEGRTRTLSVERDAGLWKSKQGILWFSFSDFNCLDPSLPLGSLG